MDKEEKGVEKLNALLEKAQMYAQFVSDETGRGAQAQQSRLASISAKKLGTEEETPDLLRFPLRDYQLEGMNWIINLWKNGTCGLLVFVNDQV
jgi:SNF2 family DNA or RNA helicase